MTDATREYGGTMTIPKETKEERYRRLYRTPYPHIPIRTWVQTETENDRRAQLLAVLRELGSRKTDPEGNHMSADKALLDYIDDPDVTKAFEAIEKWYS